MPRPSNAARNTAILKLANERKPNKQIVRELAHRWPELTPNAVAGVIIRAQRGNKGGVVGRRHTDMEIVKRALAMARKLGVSEAARQMQLQRKTIQRWRARFEPTVEVV